VSTRARRTPKRRERTALEKLRSHVLDMLRELNCHPELTVTDEKDRLFFNQLELQAKNLLQRFGDWDIEVLFPITRESGIRSDVYAMGTPTHVHDIKEEYNDIEGEQIIGEFHLHPGPRGVAEFSKADLCSALFYDHKVIGVGSRDGIVRFLLMELIL
jgi:hypothetical protein